MAIIDIISELWEQEKLPIINGLVKADGSFYLLESNMLKPSSLDVDGKDYHEWHSDISVNDELKYKNTHYYCGEGSYGGEGYLLALNTNNEIEWLFFDENANPIEKIWVENEELHTLNNNNVERIFPVDHPELMRINNVRK